MGADDAAQLRVCRVAWACDGYARCRFSAAPWERNGPRRHRLLRCRVVDGWGSASASGSDLRSVVRGGNGKQDRVLVSLVAICSGRSYGLTRRGGGLPDPSRRRVPRVARRGGDDVVEDVGVEGMAVVAEVAVAEPIVKEGIGEGEGLVDDWEGHESFAGGGGKGGVLGELHEQVGNGGAMLGGGGVGG